MNRLITFSLIGLVVGLLGMIYSYAIYGNDIIDEFLGEYEKFEENTTVNADGINELQISLDGAKLFIESYNGDEINVIHESKIYELSGNDFDLYVEKIGGELHIELEQNKSLNLSSILNEVKVTVLLPKKVIDKINISSNVSHIEINDIHLNEINIEANVATVHLNDVMANDINLELTAGSVEMNEVISHLDVELIAAKMEATLSEITRDMRLDADGRVDIILKKEPTDLAIDFMANDGTVDVDLPLKFNEKSKKKVKGSVGDGSHLLYGKIGHGKIKIYID